MLVKSTLFICITALTAVSIVSGKTCTVCETEYGTPTGTNSEKCTKAIEYIKCLDTATGDGCDTLATKAGKAYTDYDAVKTDCNPAVTATCICQMNYLKADITGAKKCTELKAELKCLLAGTGNGCDASATKESIINKVKGLIDGDNTCTLTDTCKCTVTHAVAAKGDNDQKCTAEKTRYGCYYMQLETENDCDGTTKNAALRTSTKQAMDGLTNCAVTDSCQCELNYASDLKKTPSSKCTYLKEELACLINSTGTGCDGTKTIKQLVEAVEVERKKDNACTLSETCKCSVVYITTTMGTDVQKCTAQKTRYTCSYKQALTDGDCDSTIKNSAVRTTTQKAIEDLKSVTCKLTETCKCSAAYFSAKMGTDAEKCTAGKDRYACLYKQGVADKDCDTTTTNSALRTTTKTALEKLTSVKCGLSDTCQCQLTYADNLAKDASKKCTYLKEELGCLIKATATGCDQVQTTKKVAESVEIERKKDSKCTLTGTCTCQASYLVSSEEKCKAANTLKECVGKVTDDADLACDGKTKKSDYVKETDEVVKAKCGAAGLKISLLGGLLIMLAGVFFKN